MTSSHLLVDNQGDVTHATTLLHMTAAEQRSTNSITIIDGAVVTDLQDISLRTGLTTAYNYTNAANVQVSVCVRVYMYQ